MVDIKRLTERDNATLAEIHTLLDRLEAYAMEFYGKYDLMEISRLYKEVETQAIADKTYDQSSHKYEFYFLTASYEMV
jgi:hypothetical protein